MARKWNEGASANDKDESRGRALTAMGGDHARMDAGEALGRGIWPGAEAHALLIGVAADIRSELVSGLLSCGICPELATPDPHRTRQRLSDDERQTLAIVDLLGLQEEGPELLRWLRFVRPELPLIVLVGDPSCQGPQSGHDAGLTGALHRPFAVDDVVQRALGLTSNHDYADLVQNAIREGVQKILGSCGCGLPARPLTPFLRSCSRLLAPITSVVEVSGADLWGRVLVSSHMDVMSRYAEGLLCGAPASRDTVWDALGELANLVSAEIRRHYAERGLQSHQSPPFTMSGTDVTIRHMGRCSLVVPFLFGAIGQPTFIEWVMGGKGPDAVPSETSGPPSGIPVFL